MTVQLESNEQHSSSKNEISGKVKAPPQLQEKDTELTQYFIELYENLGDLIDSFKIQIKEDGELVKDFIIDEELKKIEECYNTINLQSLNDYFNKNSRHTSHVNDLETLVKILHQLKQLNILSYRLPESFVDNLHVTENTSLDELNSSIQELITDIKKTTTLVEKAIPVIYCTFRSILQIVKCEEWTEENEACKIFFRSAFMLLAGVTDIFDNKKDLYFVINLMPNCTNYSKEQLSAIPLNDINKMIEYVDIFSQNIEENDTSLKFATGWILKILSTFAALLESLYEQNQITYQRNDPIAILPDMQRECLQEIVDEIGQLAVGLNIVNTISVNKLKITKPEHIIKKFFGFILENPKLKPKEFMHKFLRMINRLNEHQFRNQLKRSSGEVSPKFIKDQLLNHYHKEFNNYFSGLVGKNNKETNHKDLTKIINFFKANQFDKLIKHFSRAINSEDNYLLEVLNPFDATLFEHWKVNNKCGDVLFAYDTKCQDWSAYYLNYNREVESIRLKETKKTNPSERTYYEVLNSFDANDETCVNELKKLLSIKTLFNRPVDDIHQKIALHISTLLETFKSKVIDLTEPYLIKPQPVIPVISKSNSSFFANLFSGKTSGAASQAPLQKVGTSSKVVIPTLDTSPFHSPTNSPTSSPRPKRSPRSPRPSTQNTPQSSPDSSGKTSPTKHYGVIISHSAEVLPSFTSPRFQLTWNDMDTKERFIEAVNLTFNKVYKTPTLAAALLPPDLSAELQLRQKGAIKRTKQVGYLEKKEKNGNGSYIRMGISD